MGWIFAYVFFTIIAFALLVIFLRKKLIKEFNLLVVKLEEYYQTKIYGKLKNKSSNLKSDWLISKKESFSDFDITESILLKVIIPIIGLTVTLMVGFLVVSTVTESLDQINNDPNEMFEEPTPVVDDEEEPGKFIWYFGLGFVVFGGVILVIGAVANLFFNDRG